MNIVLINLLPHREARRKKRREAFYVGVAASLLAGGLLLGAGDLGLGAMIDAQQSRNAFLQSQIDQLDHQIRDIATLRQEIEALRARQRAVEDLQADRNLPVYLFEDLTADTPAGVRIDNVHQQGASVLIQGVALSQERVADFLRLLAAGHGWLEKPELIEIHSAVQNVGGDTQTVSAFQLRVTLRKPAPPTPAASAPPKGH